MNIVMFRPNLDVFGLPDRKEKEKADTKQTVIMWCQIFEGKSNGPYGGNFRTKPPPQKACGQDQECIFFVNSLLDSFSGRGRTSVRDSLRIFFAPHVYRSATTKNLKPIYSFSSKLFSRPG